MPASTSSGPCFCPSMSSHCLETNLWTLGLGVPQEVGVSPERWYGGPICMGLRNLQILSRQPGWGCLIDAGSSIQISFPVGLALSPCPSVTPALCRSLSCASCLCADRGGQCSQAAETGLSLCPAPAATLLSKAWKKVLSLLTPKITQT